MAGARLSRAATTWAHSCRGRTEQLVVQLLERCDNGTCMVARPCADMCGGSQRAPAPGIEQELLDCRRKASRVGRRDEASGLAVAYGITNPAHVSSHDRPRCRHGFDDRVREAFAH